VATFRTIMSCALRYVLIALLIAGPGLSAQKWQEANGYRWASLDVPQDGKTGFTLVAAEQSGILWTNSISEGTVARHYNTVSGAGVAAGDFDRDGFCDLYFCNRAGSNGLFRNLGNWKFKDVAGPAGLACYGRSSTGATFADVNGDGLLDLLVNSFFGTNSCFINSENGRFAASTNSGLSARGGATSLALGDIDGDGDLDLYTAYFGIEAILREGGRISFGVVGGKTVVTGRHARRLKVVDGQLVELGEQDVLYLNDGGGRFSAVSWPEFFREEDGQSIAAAPMDFGLAVQIRDINSDGFPDIFVCNDFQSPDRAWINDGQGRFRAMPRLALRNRSYASMGVDFADIDRDGRLDFITVDMLSREHANRLRQSSSMPAAARGIGVNEDRADVPRNALFWNRGDDTYAEIGFFSGLAASDWSWTPIFLDVDLDGFEDLIISTGSLYDVMDRDAAEAAKPAEPGGPARAPLSSYPRLDNPNAAFRNRGDLTFEDVSARWGFDSRQISHGMALADLDNDGDMDVAINCANAAPLIYRNDSSAPRVAVRLKGQPPNTQGTGATVKLIDGAVKMQSQEMICGGRYLSGDHAMRVFAAGSPTNKMRIEVTWRSGRRTVVSGVQANCLYEIDEPAKVKPARETKTASSKNWR
jgi:enediyne biosynthesis protein E4